jgi:hypothetical protein
MEAGLVFFVSRDDLDPGGARRKNPRHQPGAVAQQVHAQELMRGTMSNLRQTIRLFLR